MKLLLVEDEPSLARVILEGLQDCGYEADWAAEGLEGCRLALGGSYAALILDVMLPGLDGYGICRQLRDRQLGVPILMLTARSELEHKLAGFDAGADDYLAKPFDFPELVARLRSLIRRSHPGRGRVLRVADLEMDTATHEVWRARTPVALTPREYALLEYLMVHAGQVVSREQVLARVWPNDYQGSSNLVDVYVRYLRRKLDEGQPQRLIHTILGAGYSLRA